MKKKKRKKYGKLVRNLARGFSEIDENTSGKSVRMGGKDVSQSVGTCRVGCIKRDTKRGTGGGHRDIWLAR